MDSIDVSPEMLSLIGEGSVTWDNWPDESVAFLFSFGTAATFRFYATPTVARLEGEGARLILLVARAACDRLLGHPIDLEDGTHCHLPPALRAIALAIRDCAAPEAARTPYRLAKSIELLCETLALIGSEAHVPVGAECLLSRADSQRLMEARRLIEDRWSEKLTLNMIARACGLNRAKLTRGFRDMFDCSVADAIARQRLGEAGQMLIATDLPVSSIGYKCGYLNNASFTRAFSRRFGVAPTQYRARVAA